NSLLPPADVKEYYDQMTISMSQGGNALHLLAFELNPKRGRQKLVEPPEEMMTQTGFKSIINNFIRGYYEYIETPPEKHLRDSTETRPIRGLRPLLEIPFLSIENEAVILKELLNIEENSQKD